MAIPHAACPIRRPGERRKPRLPRRAEDQMDVWLKQARARHADSVQEGGVPVSRVTAKRIALWMGGGLLGLDPRAVRRRHLRSCARTGSATWCGRRSSPRWKTEPADAPRSDPSIRLDAPARQGPQLRAARAGAGGLPRRCFAPICLQVDLKLLSPFRGFVDIAYLLVEKPQANVIVSADGHTNVPSPKVPGKERQDRAADRGGSGDRQVRSARRRRHVRRPQDPAECQRRKSARAARLQPGDVALHRRSGCQPALRQRTARRREAAAHAGEGPRSRLPTRGCARRNRRSRSPARWSTWRRRAPTRTWWRAWRSTK